MRPAPLLPAVIAFAISAAPPTGADIPAKAAASPSLAIVNGETITGADLQADFTKRHGGHQKFLLGESEIRSFLGIVIDDRLLIQEAYRLELENADVVRKATEEYAARKAAEYLVRTEIDEPARPTEAQVKKAWQDETAVLYLVRQIVVDSKSEADAIAAELARGEDFEALARGCSLAPSRLHGGQLSWIGWGSMDPEWERLVFALAPGETSPVFRSKDGWEIVQLQAVGPVERPPLEEARTRIEGILLKRGLEQRRQALSDALWAKYGAKRSEIALTPQALHDALARTPGAALATWDGGQLTVREFMPRVDWKSLAGLSLARLEVELEERLRDAVNEPLVRREALARHDDEAPEVARAVRSFREDRMLSALYSDYVLKDVAVSEEEARQYFASHTGEFSLPERRRVSHLVVSTPEEAAAIRTQVAAGASFEELVQARSLDTTTAARGGDLGWVSRGEAVGELGEVFSLEEGEVSLPVQSRFGWHLVKVTAVQPSRPMEFADAESEVRRRVLERKQRDARASWVRKLRDASTISIDDAGIRKFIILNTPKAKS